MSTLISLRTMMSPRGVRGGSVEIEEPRDRSLGSMWSCLLLLFCFLFFFVFAQKRRVEGEGEEGGNGERFNGYKPKSKCRECGAGWVARL